VIADHDQLTAERMLNGAFREALGPELEDLEALLAMAFAGDRAGSAACNVKLARASEVMATFDCSYERLAKNARVALRLALELGDP
jgi:hypothetical protein